MNFQEYLIKQAQNLIFIELQNDVEAELSDKKIIFPKGDYPIEPKSLINLSQNEQNALIAHVIDGMITLIGSDPNFKLNQSYLNILKTIPGIQNYIINKIEENKQENLKKAIIYTNTLITLNPKKEYKMNRIYLLMALSQNTNQSFIQDEILTRLKELTDQYMDYAAPNFFLAEYYLDKDYDIAKHHLRRCLNDPKFNQKAEEYLQRIEIIENYDKAVALLNSGSPAEALKILIPHIEQNPNNLDAKYYAAVAYRQLQNHHKALYYLQDLLENLETPEVLNEIGINLAFLGYFNDAIEYFQKAIKYKPTDSSIITNIGVCYLNLNDTQNAKKYFNLALQKNPNDEIAKQWLKNVE